MMMPPDDAPREMRETLLPEDVSHHRAKVTWSHLRKEARARFGVTAFRAGQRELIEAVFAGRDAFGVLPTGAGKSLCFQLASLFLPKPTVVVSPLIALMKDQRDHLVDAHVDVTKVDSTLRAGDERHAREEIAEGGARVIYVTPERLENADYLALLARSGASLFVIDEAHCVSQWGHDFRPAYLALRHAIRALGRPPVLAVTATATPQILADVVAQLELKDPLYVNTGMARPNLSFSVVRTPSEDVKRLRLAEILRGNSGASIVYVATIRAAEELCAWLREGGIDAGCYHGKLPIRAREDVQSRFMAGELQTIVATSAFGLGIDKPDVRHVVHYNFPESLERYYQESGRAGRDGGPARATLLYRLEDRRIQSSFLGGKYPRRADWENVFGFFCAPASAGHTRTLAEVCSETKVRDRRAKVIVSELEAARILTRKKGGFAARARKTPWGAGDLEAVISAYARRLGDDHGRIDAVMHYAQSTRCRPALIAEYFAVATGAETCGICDNCTADASRPTPTVPRTTSSAPPFAPNRLHAGEAVTHPKFGEGAVVAVADGHVTVKFEDGERTMRTSFFDRPST